MSNDVDGCDANMDQGAVYFGKQATILAQSATDVRFYVDGDASRKFSAKKHRSECWLACSDNLVVNQTVLLYLRDAYLIAKSITVLATDPKRPRGLPRGDQLTFRAVRGRVVEVLIRFSPEGDPERIGLVSLTSPLQTLPAASGKTSVPATLDANGDLWVEVNLASEVEWSNLLGDEEVIWPPELDLSEKLDALIASGVIGGSAEKPEYAPKTDQDVFDLAHLLKSTRASGKAIAARLKALRPRSRAPAE